MRIMLGVDVGGTFTDLTLSDSEHRTLRAHKVRSTPDDPSKAIMRGILELLNRLELPPEELGYLAHGTTVATNAMIERKGGLTALVTTRGFADLLEIGNQTRPALYDLQKPKSNPLVQAEHRFELDERVCHDGSIRVALDGQQVEELGHRLSELGVDGVAICFLSSYVNPKHEERVAATLSTMLPEAFISRSAELVPEFREFPRLSTTVMNAYLGPLMRGYLGNLRSAVQEVGIPAKPYIMQSNGGVLSISETIAAPVRTVVSGPAAGVVAATHTTTAAGSNLITFDMGGTSADISLIENGTPLVSSERRVEGWPVRIPMLDIITIGAGGGSIAKLDAGGALKVGPESAGADPGPVAYGQGGTEPTVTDANLVLGRLDPSGLLGGALELDDRRASSAIEEKIGLNAGLTTELAAAGIIDVVNATMVRAIRSVSVARGYDPREFTLIAFGGAGPLHAAELARELGIPRVVVPPAAGTFCSLGLLVADIRSDHVASQLVRPAEEQLDGVWTMFRGLIEQGSKVLREEGIPEAERSFELRIEARYVRQNYELPIIVALDEVGQISSGQLCERFHAAHEAKYGYSREAFPIEFVNLRTTAVGKLPKPNLPILDERAQGRVEAISSRKVFFRTHGRIDTPIYQRSELYFNDEICGPAIVTQLDTTTLIPPDTVCQVDRTGNLILRSSDSDEVM